MKSFICSQCNAALPVKDQYHTVVTCDYCGTEHIFDEEVRTVQAQNTSCFKMKLSKAMVPLFDLDDLKDLTIMLDGIVKTPIYFDEIPGDTSRAKIRELILWSARRGLLQPLTDCVIAMRPSIIID